MVVIPPAVSAMVGLPIGLESTSRIVSMVAAVEVTPAVVVAVGIIATAVVVVLCRGND